MGYPVRRINVHGCECRKDEKIKQYPDLQGDKGFHGRQAP